MTASSWQPAAAFEPTSNLSIRTVRVLGVVAAHHDGIGLSELSRASGIPKATCLRILRALETELLVTLDATTRRYHPAIGLVTLFGRMLEGDSSHLLVYREVESLAADTQETAGLDVRDRRGVTVVMQVRGPQMISHDAPVPRIVADWAASTGKVFHAWRDQQSVRDEFENRLDDSQLTTFLANLEEVRKRGYGWTLDEPEEGVAAVAYPIWIDGTVRAAVWVGGPAFRITKSRVPELAARLKTAAERNIQLSAARGSWMFTDGRYGAD